MSILDHIEQPSWMAEGNCRGIDPELFFPSRGEATAPAKAVCRACDVQAECLAYALNNGEKYGIWGGMSERERRRLRRQRPQLLGRGGAGSQPTLDYAEIQRIALDARAQGLSAGRAVADHYGITVDTARARIGAARRYGYDIPHDTHRRIELASGVTS